MPNSDTVLLSGPFLQHNKKRDLDPSLDESSPLITALSSTDESQRSRWCLSQQWTWRCAFAFMWLYHVRNKAFYLLLNQTPCECIMQTNDLNQSAHLSWEMSRLFQEVTQFISLKHKICSFEPIVNERHNKPCDAGYPTSHQIHCCNSKLEWLDGCRGRIWELLLVHEGFSTLWECFLRVNQSNEEVAEIKKSDNWLDNYYYILYIYIYYILYSHYD